MAETWFWIQLFNFRVSLGNFIVLGFTKDDDLLGNDCLISEKAKVAGVLFVCPVSFKSSVLWVIHYRTDPSFLFI